MSGGIEHRHAQYIPGCFRCELSRDEDDAALEYERDVYEWLLAEARWYAEHWAAVAPGSLGREFSPLPWEDDEK